LIRARYANFNGVLSLARLALPHLNGAGAAEAIGERIIQGIRAAPELVEQMGGKEVGTESNGTDLSVSTLKIQTFEIMSKNAPNNGRASVPAV
jgi:hypothetical protein